MTAARDILTYAGVARQSRLARQRQTATRTARVAQDTREGCFSQDRLRPR
jgi:hypothetical protein